MAAVTICSDFGAPQNKISHCFHCSPSICHEVMGLDAMIFVFWMLSFKLTFWPSSFTFIKRLFSSSSLSGIRVMSSAYLRLLIFLPTILIPACAGYRCSLIIFFKFTEFQFPGALELCSSCELFSTAYSLDTGFERLNKSFFLIKKRWHLMFCVGPSYF